MKNAFKMTLGALAIVAASAVSAVAAVVNAVAPSEAQLQNYALTSTALPADVVGTPGFSTVSGSLTNVYRSPFDSLASFDAIKYFTVGSPGFASSPVTLTFSGLQQAFEMLWGSIDSYNSLVFYRDDVEVFTAQGGTPPLNPATGAGVAYVTITGLLFDRVDFVADGVAFEFSNLKTTAVPLPAGGLLLLTALGGIAALRRRKTA